MRNQFIVVVLTLLLNGVSCLQPPINGYEVVDLVWKVQAKPGEEAIKLNGTVQQVLAQLLKINPNYHDDFAPFIANSTTESNALLEPQYGVNCHPNNGWDDAGVPQIRDGIEYLRTVSGVAENGPGPGNCGRVSCSQDSAIWWCNDNPHPFPIPGGFNTIANCAQEILNECVHKLHQVGVVGQNFNGDNWNCIVRRDNC